MNEDQELTRLEKEWKTRFDRYTSPEPTREQSFQLLARIREREVTELIDPRSQLEAIQADQSTSSKVVNLFLSQWNMQGTRSWLLSGIVMLLLTVIIHVSVDNEMTGLLVWMKWMSLLMVVVMWYAFRSRNKGNDIIEMLSYYPLLHQMFARFVIIITFQVAIALPLSFFILGQESSVLNVLAAFAPLFFFGVVGFISAIWFGSRGGIMIALFIWFSQFLLDQGRAFHCFSCRSTNSG